MVVLLVLLIFLFSLNLSYLFVFSVKSLVFFKELVKTLALMLAGFLWLVTFHSELGPLAINA
jgi:hypothetical protein